MQWPEWWNWDIELTPHIEKRMVQRGFNEIDLRTMLHNSIDFSKDREPGRYNILSKMGIMKWEIIVEPDYNAKSLVVVAAYPKEE